MASIWLGDLYREASLSTKWRGEKTKLLVISLHNAHSLPLWACLLGLKSKRVCGYSNAGRLNCTGKTFNFIERESKMEMLSVALGCLLLQSNRLAGMQDALWIRAGYKRQSKLLVQSDSFHHPRRWRVKSLCNILSLSLFLSRRHIWLRTPQMLAAFFYIL